MTLNKVLLSAALCVKLNLYLWKIGLLEIIHKHLKNLNSIYPHIIYSNEFVSASTICKSTPTR